MRPGQPCTLRCRHIARLPEHAIGLSYIAVHLAYYQSLVCTELNALRAQGALERDPAMVQSDASLASRARSATIKDYTTSY